VLPLHHCRVIPVGAAGFEPTTSRTQTERSTKLSYAPSIRLLPVKDVSTIILIAPASILTDYSQVKQPETGLSGASNQLLNRQLDDLPKFIFHLYSVIDLVTSKPDEMIGSGYDGP
jgi:hypothetical protein